MDTIKDNPLINAHYLKLVEIYKKFFGYYRTDDADAKLEIEEEAKLFAKEVAEENYRAVKSFTVTTTT